MVCATASSSTHTKMFGKQASLPWKTKVKISVFSFLMDLILRRDCTLNRRLLSLVDINVAPNPKVLRGVRTADVTVDQARGLWFRLFLPLAPPKEMLPVVVFFHGGGFALLSAVSRDYDALCRRFCRKLGVAVVSVNYCLSPEHRFPAQYDDGVDVLRFLESSKVAVFSGKNFLLEEFFQAADLSSCFLAGDSSGGNIAHHVAHRWTADVNHHVRLSGLIAIQPFFGGEARVSSEMRLLKAPFVNIERTDWLWKAFLPDGASREHRAANPAAAAEDLGESFPPVMVMVGELDPLKDWQRIYYQSLRKNGKEAEIVEYPGAIHGCCVLSELEASTAMIEDMRSFIFRRRPPAVM